MNRHLSSKNHLLCILGAAVRIGHTTCPVLVMPVFFHHFVVVRVHNKNRLIRILKHSYVEGRLYQTEHRSLSRGPAVQCLGCRSRP